jgi:hypothetical protein
VKPGKSPLVKGFSGREGRYTDLAAIEEWVRIPRFARANVAIRLPHDVIGIDVDAHSGKPGGETLADLESVLGPLPETWISTARSDGVSGIRLYRVPVGQSWPGEAGPGIDIITAVNRYVIVHPSIHPTGAQYRWNWPGSPTPEDLPPLPAEWVDDLSLTIGDTTYLYPEGWTTDSDPFEEHIPVNRGRAADSGPERNWDNSLPALRSALREHGTGEPCERLQQIVFWADRMMKPGRSHDIARNAIYMIHKDWLKGHVGASAAFQQVRDLFLVSAGNRDRRGRTALQEWRAFGLGLVPPGPDRPCIDPCEAVQAHPAGLPVGLTPERIAVLKARLERKRIRRNGR